MLRIHIPTSGEGIFFDLSDQLEWLLFRETIDRISFSSLKDREGDVFFLDLELEVTGAGFPSDLLCLEDNYVIDQEERFGITFAIGTEEKDIF